MKKPVEAIKRWRNGKAGNLDEAAIIAYLDSIPEWPAGLTREWLEELASNPPPFANNDRSDALRRLAAIAPKAEKMKLGDKVEKIGGDYTFAGVIVADFIKLSGARRFVVEDDRGVLHVYSEKNLRPSSAEIDA